jgi:hypothetical protein
VIRVGGVDIPANFSALQAHGKIANPTFRAAMVDMLKVSKFVRQAQSD